MSNFKEARGLPYLCPACGGTKKGKNGKGKCKVCKGKGRVDLNVIHAVGKKPKRSEHRDVLWGRY